jgi:hypothetical protein
VPSHLDGHDEIWNLVKQIGEDYQRREVLDWYHLNENLHKLRGSQRIIRQFKNEKHQPRGLTRKGSSGIV